MTDKELKRLKRADLLEIMFYLRDEIDNLKKENESLELRIDELLKTAANAKTDISDVAVLKIAETVVSMINQNNQNEKRD